jgi:hypothetical protein
MFNFASRRFCAALAVVGLLCMLTLSGCDLQPAIVDVPTPVPTATLMALKASTQSKGYPTTLPIKDPSKLSPEPTLEPGKFTYANGVPFPVPSTQANPIEATDMPTAWGTNLSISRIPSLVDSEHLFLLRGIDENGHFLVGEVAPTDPTSFEESKLALMDLSNKAVTYLPDAIFQNDTTSYIWSGVAVDGDWIVWQQNDGQTTNKANVKIYNRSSGKLSHLEITHLTEPGVPGMLTTESEVTSASVDHGMFVWTELDQNAAEQGKVATVIKAYDFTTGQSTVIGKHGVAPSISWPYVAWLQPDLTTVIEGEVCSNIVTKNLETGATNALQAYCDLRGVAMHDDWVASSSDGSAFIQTCSIHAIKSSGAIPGPKFGD